MNEIFLPTLHAFAMNNISLVPAGCSAFGRRPMW